MSPPAVPMMTLSLTTIGDIVIEKRCVASATTRVPQQLAALRVDREQVRVDRAHDTSVSPRIARPRFTRPQQVRASGAGSW